MKVVHTIKDVKTNHSITKIDGMIFHVKNILVKAKKKQPKNINKT